MEFQDGIQILTRLGLALRQARVYLALVQSGVSSVKEISMVSNVPREDLYRILSALQELSLVEKGITVPVTFKAVPINDALSVLHERRINETSELQVKIKNFLEKFKENFVMVTHHREESQFVLIPRKEAIVVRRRKSMENAQTSLDAIDSWARFSSMNFAYREVTNKMRKRSVKGRLIINLPEDKKSLALLKELEEDVKTKKHPLEIRHLPNPPSVLLAIYDRKEVLLDTAAASGLADSPVLWSNNPGILTIVQDYFEKMWLTALEVPE